MIGFRKEKRKEEKKKRKRAALLGLRVGWYSVSRESYEP